MFAHGVSSVTFAAADWPLQDAPLAVNAGSFTYDWSDDDGNSYVNDYHDYNNNRPVYAIRGDLMDCTPFLLDLLEASGG